MNEIVFDTHRAVKSLIDAGFDDAQAEAVVGAVGDAMGGNVATKTDIAELKADMLKIAIGIVVANAGLTLAIVKLL